MSVCSYLDVGDRRRRGIPGHDVDHADVSHLPASHSLLEAHEVSVEAALEGDEAHHARLLHNGGHLTDVNRQQICGRGRRGGRSVSDISSQAETLLSRSNEPLYWASPHDACWDTVWLVLTAMKITRRKSDPRRRDQRTETVLCDVSTGFYWTIPAGSPHRTMPAPFVILVVDVHGENTQAGGKHRSKKTLYQRESCSNFSP